jgi:hypothetical protein
VSPVSQAARRLTAPRADWDLRTAVPVSRDFGRDRGDPVDRRYVARFLGAHSADITGRVSEVGDDRYTLRFDEGVRRSDVLDVDPSNRRATILADLCTASAVTTGSCELSSKRPAGGGLSALHARIGPAVVLRALRRVRSRSKPLWESAGRVRLPAGTRRSRDGASGLGPRRSGLPRDHRRSRRQNAPEVTGATRRRRPGRAVRKFSANALPARRSAVGGLPSSCYRSPRCA